VRFTGSLTKDTDAARSRVDFPVASSVHTRSIHRSPFAIRSLSLYNMIYSIGRDRNTSIAAIRLSRSILCFSSGPLREVHPANWPSTSPRICFCRKYYCCMKDHSCIKDRLRMKYCFCMKSRFCMNYDFRDAKRDRLIDRHLIALTNIKRCARLRITSYSTNRLRYIARLEELGFQHSRPIL
jgi:hypothetical protein